MILLKANPKLRNVFEKLIKTMDVMVTWTDVFVIINNNLILAGDVRSLIFTFDDKKIYTNIIEIPIGSKQIDSMPSDGMLENVLNMTLYAFGKWGSIGSLRVERDYAALNDLFKDVLRPVNIEPDFNSDGFRFYKDGIQITYEDTVLDILRLLRNEGKLKEGQNLITSEVDTQKNENPEKDDWEENSPAHSVRSSYDMEDDGYSPEIGLWHNLIWKKETCEFEKQSGSADDTAMSRIGNDFYITDNLCPKCKEKLYMAMYPSGKELLIDTEEGRVFMARTYTCYKCNSFYTPRPKRLLQEGDVYILKFDEDRTAYEDYLAILGNTAERTANYKFNEFESERNGGTSGQAEREKAEQERLEREEAERELAEQERLAREEAERERAEQERMERERLEQERAEQERLERERLEQEKAEQERLERERIEREKAEQERLERERIERENAERERAEREEAERIRKEQEKLATRQEILRLSGKNTDELRLILSNLERKGETQTEEQDEGSEDSNYMVAVRETLRKKLAAKYAARMGTLGNLSLRQLSDLKNQIEGEDVLYRNEKEEYLKQIETYVHKAEAVVLDQKVELSRNKSYAEIEQIIEDVEKRNCPDEIKQDAMKKLEEIKAERAKLEVEHLISHIPLHLDRKQLAAYMDKIDKYREVDLSPYREQLEQKANMAEEEEISAMMKRGGKKDRSALWNLYEELKARDYKEENKAPYLEKIYEKIREMDEAEIDKICPSITRLSFDEGLKIYEQIEQGMFLPEIKVDTLEMIKRRLTKLKTDESVQLMRKLKRDIEEKMPDCNCFYYYDARAELKKSQNNGNSSETQYDGQEYEPENRSEDEKINGNDSKNREAMMNAIDGYASSRDTYEYPLMVCDITRAHTGKDGFVITPDHIFYHTFFNSGRINITDIAEVQTRKGLFGQGIYAKHFNKTREKLPTNVKKEYWDAFTRILNEFVNYLQEKPESRSLEYMAQESHDVKCCYRCGHVYTEGNICPKCGSKMNK